MLLCVPLVGGAEAEIIGCRSCKYVVLRPRGGEYPTARCGEASHILGSYELTSTLDVCPLHFYLESTLCRTRTLSHNSLSMAANHFLLSEIIATFAAIEHEHQKRTL